MIIVVLTLLGLLAIGVSIACFVEALGDSNDVHENGRYILVGIALCVLSVLFLSQVTVRLDALEAAQVAKEQR